LLLSPPWVQGLPMTPLWMQSGFCGQSSVKTLGQGQWLKRGGAGSILYQQL
jgi:hypothetical protein